MALNCFLTQKSVFRMTRGRSRKRYQTPRKSTGENDHSQSGQGEEIATVLLQLNAQVPEEEQK